MSGEEYTRKVEECRKQLNALKKDIVFRDEQLVRNEPTYALDAEIRGQFVQAVFIMLSRKRSWLF
jgi:ABC-type arginine transport system ATPase subunit